MDLEIKNKHYGSSAHVLKPEITLLFKTNIKDDKLHIFN
jgi:hypothetical protein